MTNQVSIRFDEHLKEWVAKRAKKNRRSFTQEVLFILEDCKLRDPVVRENGPR